MKTEDFLDILEQRRLVRGEIIAQLREKAQHGEKRITAKSVLKYLVKKELVTRQQAKDLLTTTLTVNDKAESSILGFVPLPEQPTERPAAPTEPMVDPAEPPEVVLYESSTPSDPTLPPPPPTTPSPSESGPLEPLEPSASPSGILDEVAYAGSAGGALGDEFEQDAEREKRAREKKKRREKKGRKQSEWDSPLLLLGGGALVLFIVGGGVIYYLLGRENSDAVLQEASDFFAGGSYSQAERSYEHFIEGWPNHPQHSHAKVRLGMTQIRMRTEGKTNFAAALETAQQVLDRIQDEAAFAEDRESKSELSSLLTDMAEGLANQADQANEPATVQQRIDQTKAALALLGNTKFVPTGLVLKDRLATVRETLDRVARRQQREVDLAAAIRQIDEAVANQDIAAAYAVHKGLTKKHAVLRDNEQLAEKVLEIAAAEQAAVKFSTSESPAETSPRESPVAAALALADRQGQAGPDVGVAVIRVDGALYGLAVRDGALLWRRFVGFSHDSWPTVIGARAYAADFNAGELLCVAADTGKILWRQQLDDRVSTPVELDDRLLVAGASGKLYVVERDSGRLLGAVQFGQPLQAPPVVNAKTGRIYLAGRHSNLYTLSAEDFSCLGVAYLGHAAEAMPVAPLVVSNKIVVAENTGVATSHLRVLHLDQRGVVAGESANRRYNGLITTPLGRRGRRVSVTTSQGYAAVLEVGPSEGEASLIEVAARDGDAAAPAARFQWLGEQRLWMAGNELTRFGIVAAGNRLPVRSLDRNYPRSVFDQPLRAFGQTLVHVRREPTQAGVFVGAVHREQGTPLWETHLAAPLVGPPAVHAKAVRMTAATANGRVFSLPRETLSKRVSDNPLRADQPTGKPLDTSVDLGGGGLAAGAVGGKHVLHFAGDDASPPQRLPLPGELTCELALWGNSFVAAADVGQVFVWNALGEQAATPFQPAVEPGQKFSWLPPVGIGVPNDGALFVSDGVRRLYRVQLIDQPQPHLEAAATSELTALGLATRLAIAGEYVIAGNSAGELQTFRQEDLEAGPSVSLGSPLTWGPFSAEDGVLLTLESDQLTMVDAAGVVRWQQPLERGPLAGAPLVAEGAAWLTYRNGVVSRIELSNGAEAAFADAKQPLASGPVAFGPRLVVAGADGAILVINRP